jgi:hypothetical protein
VPQGTVKSSSPSQGTVTLGALSWLDFSGEGGKGEAGKDRVILGGGSDEVREREGKVESFVGKVGEREGVGGRKGQFVTGSFGEVERCQIVGNLNLGGWGTLVDLGVRKHAVAD